MEDLFPVLPEDDEERQSHLAALSDEDLANLLKEHEVAAELIDEDNEDFIKGMEADEVLASYKAGVEQIKQIVAEQKAREDAIQAYNDEREAAKKERLQAVGKEEPVEEEAAEEEASEEEEAVAEDEAAEVVAEAEAVTAEAAEEKPVDAPAEEPVAVTASGNEEPKQEKAPVEQKPPPASTRLRRPVPRAAKERQLQDNRATLVAAAGLEETRAGVMLDRMGLAETMKQTAIRRGRPSKHENGSEERILVARAEFPFPEERRLTGNIDSDTDKIRGAGNPFFGKDGIDALIASGGLCAPLTPIYSMPNFASLAEPVWDSLPVFQADRGGVNVPTATIIGDITTAISSISEAFDAAGGSSATKSCQDLDCPTYTEVAIEIFAHCREYGNLNAMAWPEKIAHENDLTMAALARTTEGFMLDRIKALSVNVTSAQVLGAYSDLVDVLVRQRASVRYVLRQDVNVQYRVLAPAWLGDLLADDVAQSQFDRYQNQAAMIAHLESLGFAVTLYLDTPSSGTTQAFASQGAGAASAFPTAAQIALYPEGEFLGVDSGSLELGIVRDSSLNSTNDFQIFGERFRNLARIGPAQGARWISASVCPSGEYPSLSTARC